MAPAGNLLLKLEGPLAGEEMGTGARGAPVPKVGLRVKIKLAQYFQAESRPNEENVNSA
jgi:hypothetical protein